MSSRVNYALAMEDAMKYLALTICIILAGCSIQPLPDMVPAFDTPQAAADWVYAHIDYIADPFPHCQTPEETLERGAGDCEDLTLLTQSIVWDQLGINVDMVVGFIPEVLAFHATPCIGGEYLHEAAWHREHFVPLAAYSYQFATAIQPILGDEIALNAYLNYPHDWL
jgi:hypothetical protein